MTAFEDVLLAGVDFSAGTGQLQSLGRSVH